MKSESIKISVVIAVYKSSDILPELLKQLKANLDQICNNYEVILVEDVSPDNSWAIIKEQAPQYPFLSAIRLMRNSGQAHATLCGMAHAKGDLIVTMDDDLQHRPDQLSKLIKAIENQTDIDCVFGAYITKQHTFFQNISSRIIRWINMHAAGLPRNVSYSSFRVMRRPLVDAILSYKTRNPAISSLIFEATQNYMSVPVDHSLRYSGKSSYNLSKKIKLALDNITNVSMLPLRAVSGIGIIFCFFSFLFTLIVLIRYLYGQIGVAGWTTVVILISFLSGSTLLSIGVIGEYLVRVLREVRGAPKFVVREKLG